MSMKTLRNLTFGVCLLASALLTPATRADDKADAYKFGKDGIEAAKNKEWDKAIDLFQKAVKAEPKEPNNHNNLGLAYKGAGKMEEAVKAFSGTLEVEPDNYAAYLNRGIVNISLKKYTDATQDLTRAIKLKDSVSAHRFRAFAYLGAKDYARAVEDYNVVLKEKENDVEILDRRAFALWNVKEYDKAIADFSKIIKEKPQNKEAYLDRSYVYELKKDYAKGIADCDKVLSLDPNNEDAKNRKARLEYGQKKGEATPTPSARPRRTLPPEPEATPLKRKKRP
ncbi:MAG: tetratricopeptide repeat protein [Chthoniobacterales bacterium]